MTYRPKQKGKKELILSLCTAITAVFLIIISGIINKFGGLYQISAIICGVISIEIYMKYIGSDYIYEAADDAFKVFKVTGKKSICVSSLDYEMSLSLVVSSKEYKENIHNYPKSNFDVNFCKNLAPDDFSVYFFEFNGKKSMMKFEPDDDFTLYINKKIADAWENGENDDE